MKAALYYKRKIVLVHDQASCMFPGVSEQPQFMQDAKLFDDKAITLVHQFVRTTLEQVWFGFSDLLIGTDFKKIIKRIESS